MRLFILKMREREQKRDRERKCFPSLSTERPIKSDKPSSKKNEILFLMKRNKDSQKKSLFQVRARYIQD